MYDTPYVVADGRVWKLVGCEWVEIIDTKPRYRVKAKSVKHAPSRS